MAGPSRVATQFAALLAALMAVVYLLLWRGVLDLGAATDGELGILGVAGGVHLVLAVLLLTWRRPALWIATVVLQVLLAAMYVAIAAERDPAYEVWGLTIRGLSVVLVVVLVTMLVGSRRVAGSSTAA